MRTISTLLAVILSILIACDKPQDRQVTPAFDVVAKGMGGDCKLPLLDFGSRTSEVEKLVGMTSANELFFAINLDTAYSKNGTSLKVTIRKAAASEERACTTLGPFYPIVTVTSVTTQ